jgi:hypothetical protein
MTAEFERFFNASEEARKEIVALGQTEGSIQCPICGLQLDFRVSNNGHVHAACIDPKCLRWME